MKNRLIVLLLLLFATTGFAQQIKNMTLVGQATFPASLNDVWAWVDDSTGVEYAIVGRTDGVSIMDLSTPATPAQVQFIPGANSIWRDMKTWKNHAFITNETSGGLLIIDMNGVPGNWAWKDTSIAGLNSAHNIYIDDGVAYVVGGDIDNGGITMYDVDTDPWHPSKIGAFSQRYCHDVYVRNEIAYAAEINDGLLEIIDVSNPASPQVLGSRSYANSFTHNTWLNDAGTVVFTTDELADAYVYAWDVTNPSNIVELDAIRSSLSNETATPHNTHVLNDFLVTAYYKDGIHIVDAARPHNLIEVGYYDTNNLTGGGTDGCWGAYPFLPSGLLLATDINEGLFVFQATYQRGCYLEGTVTDSVTGATLAGVQIDITGPSVQDFTDGNGDYATGLADAGNYSVSYSKFGYVTKTLSVNLSNGTLVTEDVELAPLETSAIQLQVVSAGNQTPIPNANVTLITGSGTYDYTTDSNGEVNDALIPETYTVYAGRWGWRTGSETFVVGGSSSNNLVIELEEGYYDDFVFDFGWTVSGGATAGIWERGEPVGTTFGPFTYNPDFDLTNDFGDQAYVTGNGGGNAGSDDVDNGATVLKSPVMDLSNYTNPRIQFYRWFANGGGSGQPNDEMTVELSDGNTTVTLITIDGVTQNSWKQDTFNIQSFFANPTSNMQVIITCSDASPGHLVEGGMDLFEVISQGPISGVEEEVRMVEAGLEINPNPATANSVVSFDYGDFAGQERSFVVTDLQGRVVYEEELKAVSGEISWRAALPAGLYIASLKSNDDVAATFKVVVQ